MPLCILLLVLWILPIDLLILHMIPLFPIFPFLCLDAVIEHLTNSCETRYKIGLFFLTFLLFIIITLEILNAKNSRTIDYKTLKKRFRLVCVALTFLLNPILLISFYGFEAFCNEFVSVGILLVTIPVAALSYPILGLIYDIVFTVTYKSEKPK